MLEPDQRGYYRNKVQNFKKKYDLNRKKFFQIEDGIEKVYQEFNVER